MEKNHGEGTPFDKALQRCRKALVAVFAFSFVINMLMLVAPIYMLQIYDRVLTSASVDTLVLLTVVAVIALILLAALDSLRSMVLSRVGAQLEVSCAPATFTEILNRGGTSQPLRDLEGLRSFYASPALQALFDAPWTPFYLAAIYLLHPWLGHLALAGALVLLVFAITSELITRRALAEASQAAGQAHRFVDVCGRQHAALYSMGMTGALAAAWRKPHAIGLSLNTLAAQRIGFIAGCSKGLRFLLQTGILGLGAYLALQQITSPGVMIAASIIMGRALAPIEASIAGWRTVSNARTSKNRLKSFHDAAIQKMPPMPLPDPKGALLLDQVSFQFPERERPVLQDISLSLEPGTVLGVTGPNAVGKSTLAKLILGLYTPSYGELRLDGADYQQWPRQQVGKHLGYLPQEVELFPGTVAENIARFTDASSEQVVDAAKQAGAHELIMQLPEGYNSPVGNYGECLSGGQRQRIALARALFGNPSLVVLDEPSSSLDAEAEASVRNAISNLKQQGTTVVVIGHRPALMNVTDLMLVLQNGRVATLGPSHEVMGKITKRVSSSIPTDQAIKGAG